ncbi:hypothetical protein [Yunchengibacter salinarum]|uniref:hypothetical protein n=1 Tax=Yunchengibacter salinarum TaxID=3133399 RepID=UPI0035B656F3
MDRDIILARRFNGPPNSANGGYASGCVAAGLEKGHGGNQGDGQQTGLGGTVSLKAPPPLDRPLRLSTGADRATLHDPMADRLLAVAEPGLPDVTLPALQWPPRLDRETPLPPPGAAFAPFDGCFVCGSARTPGDGLCLHPSPVAGRDDGLVAAPWTVSPDLLDNGHRVAPEYLWAALDCPGYFACAAGEAALLARFSVRILERPGAEDGLMALGWPLSGSGRKRRCGTALVGGDGRLLALAEGLWVVVDPATITGGTA